jgi:hypothetical protein
MKVQEHFNRRTGVSAYMRNSLHIFIVQTFLLISTLLEEVGTKDLWNFPRFEMVLGQTLLGHHLCKI